MLCNDCLYVFSDEREGLRSLDSKRDTNRPFDCSVSVLTQLRMNGGTFIYSSVFVSQKKVIAKKETTK